MRDIESNIPKMYVIKALKWFMLIIPVLVIFYQDNGLSMSQVMIIQAVFSISVVLLEVPSGYFSDVFGRKRIIIAGLMLGSLGFLIYCFSYGFWGFLIAEIVMGIGFSFISGSDSALIYDTLLQKGRETEYKKIEGRYSAIGNFSEGIASIIGGLLAAVFLRLPFYFETALMFITIPVAFTLIEPKIQTEETGEHKKKRILAITRFSLIEHKELKWLIIYSALVGASTLTMVWLIQPYFKLSGLPLKWFGVVWAILQFSVGLFSWIAHRMEKRLGKKKSLLMLIPLSFIGYILCAVFQNLWAIPFLLIFYFVRGFSTPVVKDYLNQLIGSDRRATVLSIKNLIARLFFSIVGPIVGWMHDLYSMREALLLAGGIFLVSGLISIFYLKRHKVI